MYISKFFISILALFVYILRLFIYTLNLFTYILDLFNYGFLSFVSIIGSLTYYLQFIYVFSSHTISYTKVCFISVAFLKL